MCLIRWSSGLLCRVWFPLQIIILVVSSEFTSRRNIFRYLAGISSDFETSFASTSVDCHHNDLTGKDDCTLASKTERTTDKVVLRDHPYCKTFSKGRVSKAVYKEMNLNLGYPEHFQRGISINLPEKTNDSKQKKERKIDSNIKERSEQSEIINKLCWDW